MQQNTTENYVMI